MKSTRPFKEGLSEVLRRWDANQYDQALVRVEELLSAWPGNSQLYILWAGLVQLQENPTHTLDEAKKALQHAVDLDRNSPAGMIELGHFLDAVEDNPQAASRAFAEGVLVARRSLIEGLLGQARALLQLNKREEALRCLMESLYLADVGDSNKKGRSEDSAPDVFLRDPAGRLLGFQLKGPFAGQIEDLLKEALLHRSA
jgi:predicted Zn-dependent protease